ncbi:hypothetical protein CFP56_007418 [Quercus suber]|uniref:Uncharacterized protein n=1 Tax=Quercus suber TaxID=58331 RepID=A0AAW0IEL8_QUESU
MWSHVKTSNGDYKKLRENREREREETEPRTSCLRFLSYKTIPTSQFVVLFQYSAFSGLSVHRANSEASAKATILHKHTGCNPMKVSMSFQHNGKTSSLKVAEPGPLGLGAQFFTINSRRRIMHSSRTQSASVVCQSALNARCGAEQTQTVTREAPTITHIPGNSSYFLVSIISQTIFNVLKEFL